MTKIKTETTKPNQKFAFKTEWDFSKLYKSDKDPKIEKDIVLIEEKIKAFAKKYSNKKFLVSTKTILSALKDWEKLQEDTFAKPVWYLSKLADTDSSNIKIKAKKNLLEARIVKAANDIIFFTLSISKLDVKLQKQILADKTFAPYKYYLKVLFDSGKHILTEPEEKIISLKQQVTYSMWVNAQKALLTKQIIKFKGKDLPISEASSLRNQIANLKDRHELHGKIVSVLKSISHMAEAEIVAVYTDKKIDDDLRGYKTPYQATVEGYENDLETVENLIKIINKNMGISHRFFKARAKLLGLEKLGAPDLYAPVIKEKQRKIPTEEILSRTIEGFNKIKPEFAQIVLDFAKSGQIDFLPRKGKRGGAYCSPGTNVPTFVLMNVTGCIDDISTLSHEMGHAIHTEFSKKQPILYKDYTISVAEVASTFFEQLVIDDLIDNAENDKERLRLLDEKMKGDIGTIFRQVSFFNYELALHEKIRKDGGASKEEMAEMFVKETRNFVGPILEATNDDGYSFIAIPHFRYFFYVYTYALGQIISRALVAKYKEDNSFIEKVEGFLKSGQSMSPRDIFLNTGVDIADPKFIQAGLDAITEDIKKYEGIVNRMMKTRQK